MVDEPNVPAASKQSWQPKQLAVMCATCLAMGILAGYLLRGSAPAPTSVASVRGESTGPISPSMPGSPGQMKVSPQMPRETPTLDDMKRMADAKVAPLLAKFQADPKNSKLANQIGLLYKSAHQFKDAAGYFEKSLQNDPKNIAVRADYASCLYYTGDVDGALAQLNQSLKYDPKHAGTLMNIGIIKWKGKNDADGAVAAWEKLLQYHPDFPQRDLVQQMLTQAKESAKATAKGQKG